MGFGAPTSATGGVCKWGNPCSQESLVHVTYVGEGMWDVCAPECVWVLVCIRVSITSVFIIERCLEMCMYMLTFLKRLVLWYICCIAGLDSERYWS